MSFGGGGRFSFGSTNTFSFGSNVTTTAGTAQLSSAGLSFGAAAAQKPAGGFSLGAPAMQTGFSLGAPTTQTGFSLGAPTTQTDSFDTMAHYESRHVPIMMCAICLGQYNTPKIIPCGHSYCLKPCLVDLLKADTPECPLCRKEVQGSEQPDDFPTNFALQSLIDSQTDVVYDHPSLPPAQQARKCPSHGNSDMEYFCEACSITLCDTCVNESHDKTHDVLPIPKVIELYSNKVRSAYGALDCVDTKLSNISKTVSNAREQVEEETQAITGEIESVKESLISLVRDEAGKLEREVKSCQEDRLKQLDEFESQYLDIAFDSESNRTFGESLAKNIEKLNFSKIGLIRELASKVELLARKVSQLDSKEVKGNIEAAFVSTELTDVSIGYILSNIRNGNSPVLDKSSSMELCREFSIESNYVGFTHFLSDSILIAYREHGSDFSCSQFYLNSSSMQGKKCTFRSDDEPVHGIYHAGIAEHNLLGLNSTDAVLYKIGINFIGKSLNASSLELPDVDMDGNTVTESNDEEVDIELCRPVVQAVTWDETRQDCLVLLEDGVTVLRSNFSGLDQSYSKFKLEEKVNEVESSGFHVSSNSSMAIIDVNSKSVRFYVRKGPVAKLIRIVTAPLEISDWTPVCVTTRKGRNDWFVSWDLFSNDVQGEVFPYSRMYQYSEDFEIKWLVLKVSRYRIGNFSVFGKTLAVELFCKSSERKISCYTF